jgi:2-polyprenyl-6-methoxyphenol hydroxylase-like FAD-dependent oxidoreductase
MKPRALIIGGSVGGLLASSLLRRAGWEATIFERATGDLAGRGAGLGISQNLVDILREIGADFAPSAGSAHDAYVWMKRDGSIGFRNPRPTVGSAWPRVYQPLRALVPPQYYRQGMSLVGVEQDARSVTALFADGSRASADLLVASDGVFSTVRKQFAPEVEPVYTSYVAWRGLAEQADMSRAAVDAIGHQIVYCFPWGEMLLAMTVPGAGDDMRMGHRRVYFIWYRPVAREKLVDMFTDASGRHHGVSIPPPLIRPHFIDEVKRDAMEGLPSAVAEAVMKTPQILLQAVSDLQTPRMAFGRVAMMGDAAFIARPHTAAGVSKAALDAKCLVEELTATGDVATALPRFETKRLEFGRALCAHSRYLGAFLENAGPKDARSVDALLCDPAEIIKNYGAQKFLRDTEVSGFQAH